MNIFQNTSVTMAIGVCMVIVGVCTFAPQAHAREYGVIAKESTKKAKTASQDSAYSYTANAGDSYTQLVRKAVQTYGIQHKEDLGNARIVAIETITSERAGWPELNEGQVVSFSHSLVKTWIDEAMKLSAADVAAWATYVPYIDFDTRQIGE